MWLLKLFPKGSKFYYTMISGSTKVISTSGGYAIPFPRQPTTTGTMPAMMVTQATSPISPSSPLIAAARAR